MARLTVKVSVPPTLVGWCNECEMYVEPFTSGEPCPGDHDVSPSGTWRDYDFTKRLRKRRVYICRVGYCFDSPAFLSPDAWRRHFLEHVEESIDGIEGVL